MLTFRRFRCLALALLIVLSPFAGLAPARADHAVTGSAIALGDNGRTNRWPDPGPQGAIGIEATVSVRGFDAYDSRLIVVDGLVFGSMAQGETSSAGAWDAATGEPIWTVSGERSGEFVVVNGVAYAAFMDGVVMALDASTGEQAWQARALPQATNGSTPYVLVADGTVYVATGAYASAFDAANGTRRWAKKLRVEASSSDSSLRVRYASLAHDRLVIVLDSSGFSTLALDAATGADLWFAPGIYISMADDQLLFGADMRDEESASVPLVSADASTGSVRWGNPSLGLSRYPSLSDQGLLYRTFRTYANSLRLDFIQAIDATTGVPQWQAPMHAGWGGIVGSQVIAGGRVIVAQQFGVSAFDAATGALAWQTATPCADLQNIIGVANGRIYITTESGWIVLGGDDGPNKTNVRQLNWFPVTPGNPVILTVDSTLLDSPSASGFPVNTLEAGVSLQVIGPSVSAEGMTWWPVVTDAGDAGYLPEDVLRATGCPD